MYCDDLVSKALRTLGIIRPGEPLDGIDSATGFQAANDLLDAWAAQRLTVYQTLSATYPLVANRGGPVGSIYPPYQIGPGAPDFNQVRPEWLAAAHVQLNSSTPPMEDPRFRLFRDEEYFAIAIKTLTSAIPMGCYYDHAMPTTGASTGWGNVMLYPVPNGQQSLSLVLYTPTPLTAFTDPNLTAYTFPPGYAEALRYQLAIRLAPEYGQAVSPDVLALATSTFGVIQRPNVRAPLLQADLPRIGGSGGLYDWRLGVNR